MRPSEVRSCLVAAALAVGLTVSGAEAVANIQNLGAGARSAALGNAFVAVADDGDAVFANPAGLGQVSGRQVAYTNVSLLYSGIDGDNLGQHVASYAQPLHRRGQSGPARGQLRPAAGLEAGPGAGV